MIFYSFTRKSSNEFHQLKIYTVSKMVKILSFKILISVVFILSVILIAFLYFNNIKIKSQISLSEKTIESLQRQISILRSERNALLYPSPTITINIDRWTEVVDRASSLKYKCPPEWKCGPTDYGGNIYLDKVSISYKEISVKELNNPYYNSVVDWYKDLNIREPKSIGEGLDKMYGVIYRQGTDGYSLPFYRSYELENMKTMLVGKNPLTVIGYGGLNIKDTLYLVKNRLYRLMITPPESINDPTVMKIFSTFEGI